MIERPTCNKCGGLRPQWMKMHRRHGGFMTTWACCCRKPKGDCPPALQVEFSGVDASMCTGCIYYAPVGSAMFHSLAVDGVYLVEFQSVNQQYGYCQYLSLIPSSEVVVTREVWDDIFGDPDDACSGDSNTRESHGVRIGIHIDPANSNQIISVGIVAVVDGDRHIGHPYAYSHAESPATEYYLGDAIPNANVCGQDRQGFNRMTIASGGGTATVTLP